MKINQLSTHWQYSDNILPEHQTFPDPRIPIALHIDWTKSQTEYTIFSIPEPINYNRAVFNRRPKCYDWIRDQVIYHCGVRQGWFTVLYVPDTLISRFDSEEKTANLAYWRSFKPSKIKLRRSLLSVGRVRTDITDNELLYAQGYYEYLAKYFSDSTYVEAHLGSPREELNLLLRKVVDRSAFGEQATS